MKSLSSFQLSGLRLRIVIISSIPNCNLTAIMDPLRPFRFFSVFTGWSPARCTFISDKQARKGIGFATCNFPTPKLAKEKAYVSRAATSLKISEGKNENLLETFCISGNALCAVGQTQKAEEKWLCVYVEHSRVFNSCLLGQLVEGLLKLLFPSAPSCHLGFTWRHGGHFKNADVAIRGEVVARGKTVCVIWNGR